MPTGPFAVLAALATPVMLYAGVGAAALPILIHLLNKRRYRIVPWAATDFLREAQRRNRRRIRLQELILLALRCLAMGLIGLMLARWFIQPESILAALGTAGRTEHIVLLDDSFSMGLRADMTSDAADVADLTAAGATNSTAANTPAGLPTVFDAAKSAVLRLADRLRTQAPGDGFTIVLRSHPRQPWRTASTIGQESHDSLQNALAGLAPCDRTVSLPAACEAIARLLEAREAKSGAVVYIVSDFQAIDWAEKPAEEGADSASTSPAAAFVQRARTDRHLRVVLFDVGRPTDSNLALMQLRPEQSQAVVGVSGRYTAVVHNFGRRRSAPTALQAYIGGAALPPVPVPAVDPQQSREIAMEITFGQGGSQKLVAELGLDVLAADNNRAIVMPVARALRILLVDGERSSDPYEDEVYLLSVALRPEGPEFSGNDVTVMGDHEFELAELTDDHVVCLANVNRITEEIARKIEQYVAAGGGLLVFAGDQVNPDTYNRYLYRNSQGVLPAPLDEPAGVEPQKPGILVGSMDTAHPALRRFASSPSALFGDMRIWQWMPPRLDDAAASTPSAEPVIPTSTPASALAGAPRVLWRMQDATQTPWLVERSFGRGRVIFCATTADKEWNNLADQPVYVVLMMELMQYLARAPQQPPDQLAGEPIRLAVEPGRIEPLALLKLPTFPATPAVRLESRTDRETGTPGFVWTDTDRAGVYQFELTGTDGTSIARQVAVNVDPREGDLGRMDAAGLLARFEGVPTSYLAGQAVARLDEDNKRRELWPGVLVMLLAVLFAEQGLAWWFGGGAVTVRSGRVMGQR